MRALLAFLIVSLIACSNDGVAVRVKNDDTSGLIDSLKKNIDSLKDKVLAANHYKDSVVKVLLMEYYGKGWMDGTNESIDLTNNGVFTNRNLENARKKYWANMREFINSK